MSKWFYACTEPELSVKIYGPYDDETAAGTARDAHVAQEPERTFSSAYEDEDDAAETQPRFSARIARADGSEYVQRTDGSTVDLT
jgi:hypothetical protein